MNENLSREELLRRVEQDIRDDEETRNRFSEKYANVSIKSIEQIRIWVYQVVTLSSAILGAFILLGGNSSFVKNGNHLIIAFCLLITVIIYGISHLKNIIEKDINELHIQSKLANEILTRAIQVKKKMLSEQSKESYDEFLKAKEESLAKLPKITERKVYSYDIILLIFVMALIFLLISIIDFNWIARMLVGR
jgi:ABC-type transport system involved in cytochrome bd biosynthesis fused ATPase/permease subunit